MTRRRKMLLQQPEEASKKAAQQLVDGIAEPAEEFKTPAKQKKAKKTPKKDQ